MTRFLGRERRSEESQPYDTVWTFSKVRRLVRLAGWNVIRTDGTVHQVPVLDARQLLFFP